MVVRLPRDLEVKCRVRKVHRRDAHRSACKGTSAQAWTGHCEGPGPYVGPQSVIESHEGDEGVVGVPPLPMQPPLLTRHLQYRVTVRFRVRVRVK